MKFEKVIEVIQHIIGIDRFTPMEITTSKDVDVVAREVQDTLGEGTILSFGEVRVGNYDPAPDEVGNSRVLIIALSPNYAPMVLSEFMMAIFEGDLRHRKVIFIQKDRVIMDISLNNKMIHLQYV